jgi:ADP-L-glycero-D-manno-heptose 6-epimerase
MEKIIITGTDGFIGSNLKKRLESKYEIIEINEDIFKTSNWREEVSKYFWTEIRGVFHIGACSNTLETDVNYIMLVNYEFTKHLTDLCISKNVPIIYSSSAANYGTNNQHPSNLYGWSKYTAEDYSISRGGIGLRYFNVYGPGEEKKGKMASVAYQMTIAHREGKDIKLFPKNPRRDFVYVEDVVSANIHALDNYEILSGKYYEVGSGEARTFEDVLDTLKISFTHHPEDSIPAGYQFYTCSNREKWMPGWTPKHNIEEGISKYYSYLNY